MRITVGKRDLLHSISLLVPKGEETCIEFSVETWKVKIMLIFVDDLSDATSRFELLGQGDQATLTVKNWNGALPSAIEAPVQLGETAEGRISFLFSGYAVGSLKRFDFALFWEKANG
jgi:hypothetical protein